MYVVCVLNRGYTKVTQVTTLDIAVDYVNYAYITQQMYTFECYLSNT